MRGQVYRSRHSLGMRRKARRVTNEDHSYPRPRADISHARISSRRVMIDAGRHPVITSLGVLAVLDGVLSILIGLR